MLAEPSEYTGILTSDGWFCSRCGTRRAVHSPDCPEFTRRTLEFVAMLRIKNEGRWIREVIESILPLCDHVFVMDDHSTDDTVEICESFPEVTVFKSPFVGINEARDKNWLYDRITAECEAKWI